MLYADFDRHWVHLTHTIAHIIGVNVLKCPIQWTLVHPRSKKIVVRNTLTQRALFLLNRFFVLLICRKYKQSTVSQRWIPLRSKVESTAAIFEQLVESTAASTGISCKFHMINVFGCEIQCTQQHSLKGNLPRGGSDSDEKEYFVCMWT